MRLRRGSSVNRSSVSDHYACGHLVDAIRDGVMQMGKTTSNVTIDDLAPVDEFHIGGRGATEHLIRQLQPSTVDHFLDVGSGLGGAAQFVADRYRCRVTGIDLTRAYVEAGNTLCAWVGLRDRVTLLCGNALSVPFADCTFSGAYMLHVGMNIADKTGLFSELARVLRPGARLGVYDVVRTADGALNYPLPWATADDTNCIAPPDDYRHALNAAGFEVLAEQSRRDVALAHFNQQRSQGSAANGPAPLGLHTLMGERRPAQVRNMLEGISTGRVAPFEFIARKQ